MQCTDIPDIPILKFLRSNKGKWCTRHGGYDHSVCLAMPSDTPCKLVLAKMKMLVRRDLVRGCACGCRGDFEITEKGESLIEEQEHNGRIQ